MLPDMGIFTWRNNYLGTGTVRLNSLIYRTTIVAPIASRRAIENPFGKPTPGIDVTFLTAVKNIWAFSGIGVPVGVGVAVGKVKVQVDDGIGVP
jgi:hypothetical protein